MYVGLLGIGVYGVEDVVKFNGYIGKFNDVCYKCN